VGPSHSEQGYSSERVYVQIEGPVLQRAGEACRAIALGLLSQIIGDYVAGMKRSRRPGECPITPPRRFPVRELDVIILVTTNLGVNVAPDPVPPIRASAVVMLLSKLPVNTPPSYLLNPVIAPFAPTEVTRNLAVLEDVPFVDSNMSPTL
jgi:hypothetical protein